MRRGKASRSVSPYLARNEKVVLEMKQHWARVLPAITSCFTGLVLVIVAGLYAPASLGILTNAAWWIWLVLVGHLFWRILEWHDETFVITDQRLILVHGLIVKKVAMMPLRKVTDMSYNRSPIARIMGYGTFVLESAGQDQALSAINFVREPDARYRQICGLIFEGDANVPGPDEDEIGPTPRARTRERDDSYEESDPYDDDWPDESDAETRSIDSEHSPSDRSDEPRYNWDDQNDYYDDGSGYVEDAEDDTLPIRQRLRSRKKSEDFDGWEGSPRARRGGGSRHPSMHSEATHYPPDEHDLVTSRENFSQSDVRHTYPELNPSAQEPAGDDTEPSWSVSREHATQPQTVRKSRNSDEQTKKRDEK